MAGNDTVLPVVEEVLTVDKREFVAGRIRVRTVTEPVEENVRAELGFVAVEIERIPVGRAVEAIPEVRVEGDLTIIPVVEEEIVIQKRLILREEIHITRRRGSKTTDFAVTLRKQRAHVTREPDSARPLKHPEETRMTSISDNRRLSALFETREDAQEAIARLRALGLTEASLRMTGGEEVSSRLAGEDTGGFWDSISDFFFPSEERETYAEGMRRGGYLVTVSGIPSDSFDAAVDILDDEGSIDLDERGDAWRAEGWQGGQSADILTARDAGVVSSPERLGMADVDPAVGVTENESDLTALRREGLVSESGSGVSGAAAAGSAGSDLLREDLGHDAPAGDEVIPVVEERLRVGKRDMSLGRVRVRSYVVEEPVSEDVSLRAEHVELERRPVDRQIEAGEDAFVDRTIEAEERAEEAVVQKEARVTEEISLRRSSDEHTERVSDTVRKTEVEVDDDREDRPELLRDR